MLKKIAIATAAAALTVGLAASPAAAAKPANPGAGAGGACVQAGIAKLKELGALQLAAQQKVDYADFGLNGTGDVRLPLETGSFLSLGTVVSLHASSPELFSWCD